MTTACLLYQNISLDQWAKRFGHVWKRSRDGELMVPLEGSLVPWSQIANSVICGSKLSSNWRYDEKGFRQISPYRWTTLEPNMHRPPDGNHYFELVVTKPGHAFLNLIDASGAVYTVGLCRASMLTLGWRRGLLASPDSGLCYDLDATITKVRIDESLFAKLKERIESDKREGKEGVQLLKRNCCSYVSNLMEEFFAIHMDVRESADVHIARLICRRLDLHPSPLAAKITHIVLTILKIVLFPVWIISYALLYLISGGPFLDQGSYSKTFVDDAKVSVFQKVKRAVLSLFTGDFLVCNSTFFRLKIWQREVEQLFASHIPSPHELREHPIHLKEGFLAQ